MTIEALALTLSVVLNSVRLLVHCLNQFNQHVKEPYPFILKEIASDARSFHYYLSGNLFKQSEYDKF